MCSASAHAQSHTHIHSTHMHAHAHFHIAHSIFHTHAGADILRFIIATLKDVLGKQPSASVLLDKYTKLCVVLDEIINEVCDCVW